MNKIFIYIICSLLSLNYSLVNGQSFDIYSIYRYGDEISKKQYKKINTSEWHKQEAKKIEEKIAALKREIKIELNTSKKKKTKKLYIEINSLELKKFNHLRRSNDLLLNVYKEKIEVFSGKYNNDDPALTIIRSVETTGLTLFEKAANERQQITNSDSPEVIIAKNERAYLYEVKGLDMISSSLEGYYSYELELNNTNKSITSADTVFTSDKNILRNNDSIVNAQENEYFHDNKSFSESNYKSSSNFDSSIIIITPDALLVYSDNKELLDLIMDNYNIDNLEGEIALSMIELKEIDKKRKEMLKRPVNSNIENNSKNLNTNTDNSSNEVYSLDSQIDIKHASINIDKAKSGIIFRVQIAASHSPLTKSEINNKNKNNYQVLMFQEEGWYKYYIGEYKSYQAACQILKECGVKDAFISAYENGIKMNLIKAIKQCQNYY